ncbi:sigma-54-dependent Fis family transcriptional regulator [Sulfitobacter pseudonitzschiae]|uniref:Sigma-54-dependent Fis family transcriptional regulator n=1 Tax=Pseudosulfitobacter pseudonitzschiae TaxID=1402135 RepID=A0A073J8P1_9RHOB|nr:response regulator [Pseudosulfitobacter pseudonitzschiae]KEJ94082.1 hypothetical protein SUH3_08655 [Pseudosulfitobacter pseudonitzschiae]MBM2294886.1 sigma-54-dependent Fis family transcriptional regulator [Pseudosulfitobacter pseudonitzschiae]MBM2299802.1 sigma-54-dependent Fis family transcriptional regulator [Pseudosulfitobacter pseudonitzschiae]MBM2304723.1 sigma-54-dependent Fis family transcriptional regulator [Pseudosulfitobacter pseudonitzschiae]MBM2314496.1 sigma-54-dependent Fis 
MILENRHIALVEDDEIMGGSIAQRLELEGAHVIWMKTKTVALGAIRTPHKKFDAVVCDIKLPDGTGEDLYMALCDHSVPPPFLFVTGHGGVDQAVRLIHAGAADYLTKPFNMDQFLARLSGMISADQSEIGNSPFGVSRQAIELQAALIRASSNDRPVLIKGNRGTGKGLAARSIHDLADSIGGSFLSIDFSRLSPSEQVNILFNDTAERPALTHAAANGTLYLSMISHATDTVQQMIFEWLSSKPATKLVCGITPDLTSAQAHYGLRLDLLQRLSAVEIFIPPLANRPDDILWLMRRFYDGFNARRVVKLKGLSARCEEAAVSYPWPGNGRELRSKMERAVSQAQGEILFPLDLFPDAQNHNLATRPLSSVRDDAERAAILAALEQTDHHILEAAKLLSVSRTTLWEKMKKLGIKSEH